jgi:sulfite dehydrogenase (quinone) subunit SoeC
MHPAYSVILFTTASGAGYGLLVWLAIFGALGLAPITLEFGLTGFVLALGLVSIGLLSSTFHLGRPERAWRAVTQWRSSWLSREGVAALATYLPAGILAIGWVFFENASGAYVVAAILTVAGAVVTVWCTGMIYASLKTIAAWHQPLVAPLYLVLGLATGAVLFDLMLRVWGAAGGLMAALAAVLLAISLGMKLAYWKAIDRSDETSSTESATGLGQFGKVRPLEPPHTQPNFVMREMGYRVARKHALKLRRFVVVMAFAAPIVALLVSLAFSGTIALIASAIAVLSVAAGIVVERWLFFAEAKHVVMHYYRPPSQE